MRFFSATFVLIVVIMVASASHGVAQDAAAPTAPGVREVLPELYYMQDDAGRLVPVPGFQYRDFVELFRLKEGLAGPALPPAAVLERVTVRIDARGLVAGDTSCPVEVTCVVRQSRGGWVAVPLDLRGLLLGEPPRHDGPGRMLVDAAPDGGGYRAWFDPPAAGGDDVRHTVTLVGRLPTEATPTQDSFELRLPVANASRVEIRSQRQSPVVAVRPDATGRVETVADGDGSLVSVTGLAGDTRIRIALPAAAPAATAMVTEAECTSTVRLNGRNAIIEAVLRLTDLPPGVGRLTIALPPRTILTRVGGDATLVERKGTADRPIVEVAVERAAVARAVVEIDCEEPVDPSGGTPFETLGFAVEGIEPWRQSGRVSIVVDGDWQPSWEDNPGIRRVDPPPGERPAGFVAAFAYDVQPASMPVRIRPRRSRVLVEPEYRYDVSASQITLAARLRIAARGAPVASLPLVLAPDWVLEDVGPTTLVDGAAVRTEGDRITLPFVQPIQGDAVVELRAVKAIEPSADRVAWTMPVPQADLVGPAVVVVTADTDIELLPDATATIGLVRQTASAVEPGDAERIALAYRLDASEGAFAATRRFLPRRVEASVMSRVTIDDRQIAVDETVRLNVLYVPLEFLELLVPSSLMKGGTLEIHQGDSVLEVIDAGATGDLDGNGEPLRLVRSLLPVPLLGSGSVTVRFRLSVPRLPREATVAVDVPIPLPVVTASGRQAAVIDDGPTIVVSVRGDTWRREISGQGTVASRSYSTSKPQPFLPLAVSARTREAARVTVIEAAWIQTRLFPKVREDIATYVVSGLGGPLEIGFPEGVPTPAAVEVRLDGKVVSEAVRPGGGIVVPLPEGEPGRRLVEIRSSLPWGGAAAGLGLPWPLPLGTPTFASEVVQRRFYREVLASPDDHLVGVPAHWTSQQRWAWTGTGWRQSCGTSSDELVEWITSATGKPISATLLADEPALRQSRFVFAGVGAPGQCTVWLMPTWFIVLLASGVTLAIGLLFVYWPALLRTTSLLALVAVTGLLAAAAPDTAVLVAQAAFPGALMVFIAAGLRRVLDPPPARPRPSVSMPASSMTRHSSPTVSLIVASQIGTGSTTTAVVGRDP
jgi:hypothetical protein